MKRLAVIGCGLRSEGYLHNLRAGLGVDWKLTALADPNPVAVEVFRRIYAVGQEIRVYDSGAALFADDQLLIDAVIIGSPNAMHRESLIPALRRNLTILVEKPVATTIEDCMLIGREYESAGLPPVAIGFVLRYTPFYRKVRQLVESGAIGQVLTIDVTESLGAPLTASMIRGWRRFKSMAGPLLLEKCSHDMDVINWLAEAPALKVSSFASRTRFNPDPRASSHCRDCQLAAECRYEVGRIAPHLQRHGRREQIIELIPEGNDLCVFNCEKDLPDHQVVNIEYANGVLATFSVSMDQPRTTRTIRVSGTQGQIFGDIGLNYLRIERHLAESSETQAQTEEIQIIHNQSGHHGGDSIIAEQFTAMLRGDAPAPAAGIREGIAACMIALSAEQSILENRIVDVPAADDVRLGGSR